MRVSSRALIICLIWGSPSTRTPVSVLSSVLRWDQSRPKLLGRNV